MKPIVWLSILLALTCSCSDSTNETESTMTFNGASDELKSTEIVPTLDTPIPSGKNAIWCASFESSWKALQGLAKGPVLLQGQPEMAKMLNEASDPRPNVPPANLYVAAGWNQLGLIAQIEKDILRKFPRTQPISLPQVTRNSFIAYSYLDAEVKFKLPYRQNRAPLTFVGGGGQSNEVNTFGLLPGDSDKYHKVREQGLILFCESDGMDESVPQKFAIDLSSDSSPSQIVVARIPTEPTLSAALTRIDKEIEGWQTKLARENPKARERLKKIGPADILLVPDLNWFISHSFSQIQGRVFENTELAGQKLDIARQDILFRLDKNGAELRSTATVVSTGIPKHFLFDRPFLIYIKKRNAPLPYFAMWVDNSELLSTWQKQAN